MQSPFAPLLASAVLVLTLSACMTPATPPRDPTAAARSCPLGVDGAQLSVEDTQDGIALTFVSAEHTDELRARARDAAQMHGAGTRAGMGHDGKHGEGGRHGLQPMQLPPSRAEFAEVDRGVRLTLTPSSPGDVALLRAKVRERAEAMSSGCQ